MVIAVGVVAALGDHLPSVPMSEYWLLDPNVTYLNHGSFGAVPGPVLDVQAGWRREIERNPTAFMAERLGEETTRVRRRLADFVGADPDGLAFVRNATSGVNAVVRSIGFRPGDRIVVTDHEYNACRNVVDYVARETGARVITASVPFPIEDPSQVSAAVLDKVDSSTRLVLVDHVTSPTGLIFPIDRMVAALEPEVPVLVDGAHGPGMVSLDLDRLGASWYVGNCHKWLCAPRGVGFLWAREDRREGLVPTVVSHGWNATGVDRFRALFDWTGTDDPTPVLSLPAALDFLGSLFEGGWPELMEHNRRLVLTGRRILLDALGLPDPAPEEMIGSMASLPLPDAAGPRMDQLVDGLTFRLRAEHRIEVPVFYWPDYPHRVLRISAQVYNTPEQYERLAQAVVGELTDEQPPDGSAPTRPSSVGEPRGE